MSVETKTKIEELAELVVDLGELLSDPDNNNGATADEFVKEARAIGDKISQITRGLASADYDAEYEETEDDDDETEDDDDED